MTYTPSFSDTVTLGGPDTSALLPTGRHGHHRRWTHRPRPHTTAAHRRLRTRHGRTAPLLHHQPKLGSEYFLSIKSNSMILNQGYVLTIFPTRLDSCRAAISRNIQSKHLHIFRKKVGCIYSAHNNTVCFLWNVMRSSALLVSTMPAPKRGCLSSSLGEVGVGCGTHQMDRNHPTRLWRYTGFVVHPRVGRHSNPSPTHTDSFNDVHIIHN